MTLPESGDYTTRLGSPSDRPACLAIGAALPDYFSPVGLERMAHDLEAHELWVRERAGTMVGFAVVERKVSPILEILWLAVAPDRRGQGHGTALIEALAEESEARRHRSPRGEDPGCDRRVATLYPHPPFLRVAGTHAAGRHRSLSGLEPR